MAGFQANRAGWGLACRDAVVGALDAMVQAVSNGVVQRGFEAIEDFTIHLRICADDFKMDLLAELARKVANQTRKALDAVSERTHPAGDDLTIETIGKSRGPNAECIELGLLFGGPAARFLQLALRGVQRGRAFRRGFDEGTQDVQLIVDFLVAALQI